MIDAPHRILIAFICTLRYVIYRLISGVNAYPDYIEILSGHPGVKQGVSGRIKSFFWVLCNGHLFPCADELRLSR